MRKLLCILASALPAAASQAQDAYVIGVSGAMTGPVAPNYAPVVEAMKAYLEDVNGRGGISGRKVRIVVLDDQAQPSRAATNAKQLLDQDKVAMLLNVSLSSTYAPMIAESKRAGVPLYFAGAVCPKETYPPADPLQFCSTAFGANLDSQAALAFVKAQAKEPVRIGFQAMAIPIARAEIDYAEGLSKTLGMTAVEKQISPPPAPDYTPFATKLVEAKPNWVWSWSPWVAQVRTFESMRRLGWNGRYLTWAHLNAEEELARIKDGEFYVVGTNAFMEDNLPVHAEIRAVAARAKLDYPVSYLTEGFVAGLVVEQALRNTPWPPTPQKVLAAMNNLKVDMKGLRGGPLEWTKDNHFRTKQYYRVWRWDPAGNRIVRAQDWQAIEVKR
ncbi:MAG TPA: ABC transporter substrate-binding protein [Burkholderiales bacterium]|jgi:ABC-type branched-subunit amino acid transport system substrate-binding protein|nr:ABC transporter substrate-binding protein [Burkholderiales bacterium]